MQDYPGSGLPPLQLQPGQDDGARAFDVHTHSLAVLPRGTSSQVWSSSPASFEALEFLKLSNTHVSLGAHGAVLPWCTCLSRAHTLPGSAATRHQLSGACLSLGCLVTGRLEDSEAGNELVQCLGPVFASAEVSLTVHPSCGPSFCSAGLQRELSCLFSPVSLSKATCVQEGEVDPGNLPRRASAGAAGTSTLRADQPEVSAVESQCLLVQDSTTGVLLSS